MKPFDNSVAPDTPTNPGGTVRGLLKEGVKLSYYVCDWSKAQDDVHRQRPCDWWIYDWPSTDYYWLFGNYYWWMQPMPAHSPLARRYYDQVTTELNNSISQAVGSCEANRYVAEVPATGLNIRVSSRLDGRSIGSSDSYGSAGVAAILDKPKSQQKETRRWDWFRRTAD